MDIDRGVVLTSVIGAARFSTSYFGL